MPLYLYPNFNLFRRPLRARERTRTAAYQRERFRRRTIAEGTFAALDRLEWDKSRLRGLWKVDSEGYMAMLAHNVLKMVRRLGRGVVPPGPVSPSVATGADVTRATADAVMNFAVPSQCFFWLSWLLLGLNPAHR